MASLNSRQASRDAASFDDDRKEGRYDRSFTAADLSDWGSREGDAEKKIAVDAALAQIERAFGAFRPAQRRAA